MSETRKIKIVSCATALIVFAVPVLIFSLIAYFLVFSHDVYLWQLSRSLAAVKHPANTQRIASLKDLGLLAGNGNHCDYFVAEIRRCDDLSPKQIQAFYKNTQIWNPLNRRNERVAIGVIEKGRINTNEDWTGAGNFLKDRFEENLPQKLNNQKLYFVFFLDVGNETGCDIRCM